MRETSAFSAPSSGRWSPQRKVTGTPIDAMRLAFAMASEDAPPLADEKSLSTTRRSGGGMAEALMVSGVAGGWVTGCP